MVIDNWESICYSCIFLIPGFIINEIMDSIMPPKKYKEIKYFFSCVVYSIVNLALWCWLYIFIFQRFNNSQVNYFLVLICGNILTACFTGFIIGSIKNSNFLQKILSFFKVRMNHPIPNAWDYFFHNTEECFVIVRLKSGNLIAGSFFANSFASSDSEGRDLYLEKIYDIDNENKWNDIPRNLGIYIGKNEVETIEFYTKEDIENE